MLRERLRAQIGSRLCDRSIFERRDYSPSTWQDGNPAKMFNFRFSNEQKLHEFM